MVRRPQAAIIGLAVGFAFGLIGGAGDARGDETSATIDRIVISKSDRELRTYRGDRLVETYDVAIGAGGAGDKQREGDRRTPVGRYRIAGRHPSKKYHRFLLISYPNEADRARFAEGLASGRIPAGTGIGHSVGIHGEPRGFSWLPHKWVDWTAGCVALDDDEIEVLYTTVRDGAVVIIEP